MPMPSRAWILGLALVPLLLAVACSDFKSGSSSDGSDAGAGGDGSGTTPGSDGGTSNGNDGGTSSGVDASYAVEGTGPGPHGALPTGYCCQSDDDCRDRQCLDFGGVKICSDTCTTNDGCVAGAGFTCVGFTASTDGHCEPPPGSNACTPADQYARGAKKLGACCTPTHEGHNGFECQGGHCDSFVDDSQPYICTQACKSAVDCPGAFDCLPVSDHYSICAPQSTTSYTCTGS